MAEPHDRRPDADPVLPWEPGGPDDGRAPAPSSGGWQAPSSPSSSGPSQGPAPTPPPHDPWGFGGRLAVPRPGVVPLRPLGLGELLDGAFQYIRAHPRVVLGVSAVVAVVSVLLQAPFQASFGASLQAFVGPTGAPPDLAALGAFVGGAAGLLGVGLVVGLLANTVLTGLLVVVLSRSVLGAPVDARECWNAARPRLPGLLGVVVLVTLASIAAYAVFLLPGALIYLAGGGTEAAIGVGALGSIVGAVAALAVWVLLALAAPAYVLEGIGVGTALGRSRRLVTGRFWPVLGILLLTTIVAGIVAGLIGVPFSLVATAVASGTGDPLNVYSPLPLLITSIGTVLATTLTAPFQAGVTGLLYIDQRMRREGFDIELQRAARG
ncbi:hypothetical protein [Actinomycetospora atypica]|uniref:Glycerophosphoryl diester phosphodiesterase membrane domain-containing protein n=1 Tax=Actinomycetospora atypica TaxID=1290095 RepID=A0ABV9YPB8_9PSEU